MKTHSKRYKESIKQVELDKLYQLREAIVILKSLPKPKFNGSVDLHFNLSVDTKKSDQMIRGTVVLPHGTGKKVRIAVFCKGEHERLARESQGYVGAEIEQAIIDAMYVGFNENREFHSGDIATALRRQVPLSISARERIEALRKM